MFQKVLDKFSGPGSLEGKIAQGIVIDNADPQKLQRVKVRIAEMHSGRPGGEIPWSLQFKFSHQGHTATIGSIDVPVIGAKVLIMFPEDDEHDTYYVADYHDSSTQITELLVDYPHTYGHIDASGNLFIVNTAQDTVTFVHLSGSTVKFYQNGAMDVASNNTLKIFANGDINIKATGNVNIDGTNVYINSGHAPVVTLAARTKPAAGTAVADNY